MNISQEILKKANIIPKLKLAVKGPKGVQGTGPHRVKLIIDKEAKGSDPITGKERDEVAYLIEENGQKRSYRVPKFCKDGQIHYLVQRLAEFNEGTEVILEYTRKGIKGYISVLPVEEREEINDDDIPIVGEDDLIDENEDKQETDNPLL